MTTKKHWVSSHAAAATGGIVTSDWQATGVSIDSRTMREGELYIALHGERVNAHAFVQEAVDAGAAASMVHEEVSTSQPQTLLRVGNTFEGLWALARQARADTTAKILGVTGSVGKTSAKEMLGLALAACGQTYASSGNYNNHIGLPLNLANLPTEMDYAVFEMGMNHAGEIEKLSTLTQPDVAMITNVEAVHLEFFKDMEGIAAAKCEIIEGMQPGGTLLLNRDNAYFDVCNTLASARGDINIRSFGIHKAAGYRLLSTDIRDGKTYVEADIQGARLSYHMRAIGAHWAQLSVGVLGMVHALGADVENAARALQDFSEVKGRGMLLQLPSKEGEIWVIDDSYNASPAAMRASIAKLNHIHTSRKDVKGNMIAVLGDMRELGEQEASLHADLSVPLTQAGVHSVFVAGEIMQHLWHALPEGMRGGCANDAATLWPTLESTIKAGDTVLVKGSNGMRMSTLVHKLQTITSEEGATRCAV